MVRQFSVDVNSIDKIYSEGSDVRYVSLVRIKHDSTALIY